MFSVVNFQIDARRLTPGARRLTPGARRPQGLCCKFSTFTGFVLQILQSLALCCKFSNLVTGFVLQILHQGLCCKFLACFELLVKNFAALQSSKIHSYKLLKFRNLRIFYIVNFVIVRQGPYFQVSWH